MEEIWKDIEGYEGLYQVSNFGRVKSLSRPYKNQYGDFGMKPEKILKQKISCYKKEEAHINGYYVVSLSKDDRGQWKRVHRIVAKAFIENPHKKSEVNHKNGNKLDNNVDNLEWVTHRENCKHAWVTGLRTKSEEERRKKIQMYNIKLKSINEHDVFKIYNEYKTKKVTMKDLSEKYNVCRQTICNIVNKKNAIYKKILERNNEN